MLAVVAAAAAATLAAQLVTIQVRTMPIKEGAEAMIEGFAVRLKVDEPLMEQQRSAALP